MIDIKLKMYANGRSRKDDQKWVTPANSANRRIKATANRRITGE
jgi:hypothetical protein